MCVCHSITSLQRLSVCLCVLHDHVVPTYTLPATQTQHCYDDQHQDDEADSPSHSSGYGCDHMIRSGGGLCSDCRRGWVEGHTFVCTADPGYVDLAVGIHLLCSASHRYLWTVVHPELDQVYQLWGCHTVCVEEVGLVDEFILVAAAEEARVCHILEGERTVTGKQEDINDGWRDVCCLHIGIVRLQKRSS